MGQNFTDSAGLNKTLIKDLVDTVLTPNHLDTAKTVKNHSDSILKQIGDVQNQLNQDKFNFQFEQLKNSKNDDTANFLPHPMLK